jgi:multiple antibiotic resistance protein
MTSMLEFAFISFTSLFVIIDPFGLIPTFLALTSNQSRKERIKTARLASLISYVVLVMTFFCGEWILRIFSISLPAFQIAGGLILLLVGVDMVQARRTSTKVTSEEHQAGLDKDDVAVTPLAMPMLAGPGAMTTVILLTTRAETLLCKSILVMNLTVIAVMTYAVLHAVSVKSSIIGVIAMKIMTRLMGLILSAIAVQFILNGIITAKVFG